MAVTRRYFDRTPGVEGDVGETTRIINNYSVINEGADAAVLQEMLGRLSAVESAMDDDRRGSATIDGAVGNVELDVDRADSWLIASTAGGYTLRPVGFRTSTVETLYVTVYTTTTGHAMAFGPSHRYVGLLPSETAWTAGQKRTFRFTLLPNTDEWIAEELSAQFDLNVDAVELSNAAGSVPDTSTPTPAAPFTAAVYRFDSGDFSSGGVQADETTFGVGTLATLMSDPFTGTNSDPWSSTYWRSYVESNAACSYTIQSNKGRLLANGAAYASASIRAAEEIADGEITGTLTPDSANEAYHGITFRDDGSGNSYTLEFRLPDEDVKLYRQDDGTNTELDTATVTAIGDSASVSFRINVVGSSVRARVWATSASEPGTWTVEATDTTYESGRVYLYAVNGAAGTSRHADWDDFTITSRSSTANLAVVDVADGDAYASEISRVRWFSDPSNTDLSTWASTTPAIGDNGFFASSTVAPWSTSFDTRYDPTGQSDPSWDADGAHDLYAQILFGNTFVSVVKVDITTDNDPSSLPAPGAPTSFAVSPITNGLSSSWVAPVTGEAGAAVPATGTDPTVWEQAWRNITVPIPQVTVQGDTVLLFVQLSNASASPVITVPAGWTQVGTLQGSQSPSSRWQAVYRHTATGATADPAVSVDTGNIFGYAIVVENASASTPLDVAVVEGTNSTPDGLTTITDNAIVIQGVLTNQLNALSLGTANGFTLEAGGDTFDSGRGSSVGFGGSSVGCASNVKATAGAVTAPVWAQAGTAGNFMAWHTIALRPAATGGTTTAVGYETRVENGPWTDVGNVLTHDFTGLDAATLYSVSVRAYDSIGQRGATATTSGTTPAGTAPPATIDKTVAGYSVNANGTQHNWSVFGQWTRTGGVFLVGRALRANLAKDRPPKPFAIGEEIDKAYSNYVAGKTAGYINGNDPGGPRLNMTYQLAFTKTNAKPPNNHVETLTDMAYTARGDRDSDFRAAAQAIKDNTTGGFDWVERSVLAPSHEANGSWYASYFGVQPELVGVSALTGASATQWGSDVAAALKHAGATGDRGQVWALAWKRMAEAFLSVDPRFWFSLNLAQGSANPDGSPAGSVGWNAEAIALIDGYFHSMDVDAYCRADGRPSYNGSGDMDNPDNWTFTKLQATLDEAEDIANTYGVPVGFGEVAAQFVEPGYSISGFASDQQAAVWYRKVFDWYNARPSHLAFYWQATGDKKVGTTYVADPNRQPKTWAVLQEYFPS